MIGRKYTSQEIANSIKITSKNFMTLHEYEEMKQQQGYVNKDTTDFKLQPVEKVCIPVVTDLIEDEKNIVIQ